MRGTALFLLRAAVGILIALLGFFFVLLAHNAPSLPNTPFAGIGIEVGKQTVHLPNRIFTCTESNQKVQCDASLQNRVLNLSWQQSSEFKYNLSQCQAVFAGQPLGCTKAGTDYIGRKGPLSYYTLTGSNLSQTQLQDLQRQYLWINTLTQVNENDLFKGLAGVAIATGLLAAAFTWLYPGRLAEAFASFGSGVGTYHLVSRWLGSIPYDQVTVHGINSDLWNQLVPTLALVAAILTGTATARLIWVGADRLMRAFVSLISGLGLFGLAWVALMSLPAMHNLGVFLATGIAIAIGMVAAMLLWLHSNRSIKTFVCISSGLGAFGLLSMLFLFSLLELGYVD